MQFDKEIPHPINNSWKLVYGKEGAKYFVAMYCPGYPPDSFLFRRNYERQEEADLDFERRERALKREN